MYNITTIRLVCFIIMIFFLPDICLNAQNIESSKTVTDYDGNVYQTVIIGNQIWMAENLKSTHYSDGTPIQNFIYNNDTTNISIYGRLYRWAAAMRNAASSNLNPSQVQGASPQGWHIPSEAEWQELINYLGGESNAGGKLKEVGFLHWIHPNTGATNETGFRALPTGWYDFTGEFRGMGEVCFLTTSTSPNPYEVYSRELTSNSATIMRGDLHPNDANPIRCVKDIRPADLGDIHSESPGSFVLHNNYPNPFNSSTIIEFNIENSSHIVLKIYNTIGQDIITLVNKYMPAGNYNIKWNGKDKFNTSVSAGVYYYQLTCNSYSEIKKMIILK